VIKTLYRTIQAVSDKKIEHNGRESIFVNECNSQLVDLLNAALSTPSMRFRWRKEGKAWAAVFRPYGDDELILVAQSNRQGERYLSEGLRVRRNRYFPGYTYYYDEPSKVEGFKLDSEQARNIEERLMFDDIIFMPVGFEKLRDKTVLDIKSGIGKCLRYHGEKIGLLILGSDKEKYFWQMDVRPISIISHGITSVLAHYKEHCPWHRKGWRDEKNKLLVKETEFSFLPSGYDDIDRLFKDSQLLPEAKKYGTLINALKKLEIKSVNLCGTFNGWNEQHIEMSKVGDIWSTFLHLPAGDYQYRYLLAFTNGEIVGETKNWIFDINSSRTPGVDSYGLISYKIVR
jgi:hypothetical protein